MIGSLAANFLENPEERIVNLEKLLKVMSESQPGFVRMTVQRLAAASILAILKDVTPGYKIFHQESAAPGVKLKKDTLRLQKYETALLRCYKTFLVKLEAFVKSIKGGGRRDEAAARQNNFMLGCMCQLLVAHPHFNYAVNILHAVVPVLNQADPDSRRVVKSAVREVFRNDKRGEISYSAVRLINSLVKTRKHNVRPDVVDVLQSLRIRSVNLDREKEEEIEKKRMEARKRKLMERSTISRQEKKRKKKLAALEREMLEAKGEEGRQVKEKFFTETTKLVFTIYFRILKGYPQSKLMGMYCAIFIWNAEHL